MSNPRELSKIFTADTIVTVHSELLTTAAAASANAMTEAMSYVDSELSTIDLTSTIVTASTAAAGYTDNEINNLTTSDIEEGINLYFSNQRAIDAGSATYIPQTSQQSIINSASGAAVTYLVNSAPSTLDTLNELAIALGNDENFATTITNSLSTKLDSSTASTTYLTITTASTTYEPEIPYVSASPSIPNAGDLWIDSTASAAPILKVYNGTEWIAVSGAGGGGLKTHFLLIGA